MCLFVVPSSPPRGLEVFHTPELDTSSVIVRWKPPKSSGSDVTGMLSSQHSRYIVLLYRLVCDQSVSMIRSRVSSLAAYQKMKEVCCVAGYLLAYTSEPEVDKPQWRYQAVAGTMLETTVSNLHAGLTYYFKVQATNSMGYGPFSEDTAYAVSQGGFLLYGQTYPNVAFLDQQTRAIGKK